MRLFCFPSAGGGVAQLYSWFQGLPSSVELCPIQLPGREERRQEPPFRRMDVLVADVADALEAALKTPYSLFGHSLGALVAFELARELRRRRLPLPARLFVSARVAPQLPPRFSPIHQLPDTEFIERLASRYGPIPAAVLAEPELMSMFLPVLRSDMEILETYSYTAEPPLDLDISVFGGESDAGVDKDGLSSWAEQTSTPLAIRMFPGDHFFPRVAREDFLKAMSSDLAESLRKHAGC
jgi:medium-chain acyl-[acyl-carrier-protein] hydrolase